MSFFLGLIVSILAFYTSAAVSGLFFNQFMNVVSSLAVLAVALTVLVALVVVLVTRGAMGKGFR